MHVFDNQTWILGAWVWGSENVHRAFGRNFYSTFLWCLWLINPSVIVPYLSQQVATNCGGRGWEYLGNNRWVSHRGGLVGWRSWHYYRVTRHKLRALVTYCSPFHGPALPHCGRFSTDGDLFAQLLMTMELSDIMVVGIPCKHCRSWASEYPTYGWRKIQGRGRPLRISFIRLVQELILCHTK